MQPQEGMELQNLMDPWSWLIRLHFSIITIWISNFSGLKKRKLIQKFKKLNKHEGINRYDHLFQCKSHSFAWITLEDEKDQLDWPEGRDPSVLPMDNENILKIDEFRKQLHPLNTPNNSLTSPCKIFYFFSNINPKLTFQFLRFIP